MVKNLLLFGDDILEQLRIDYSVISSLLHLQSKNSARLHQRWFVVFVNLQQTDGTTSQSKLDKRILNTHTELE
jgi:hypothetical protein